MGTGKKVNNRILVLCVTIAVVALLGCLAVVWRFQTQGRPPTDPVLTGPSSGQEPSGELPADSRPSEPTSGDDIQEPPTEDPGHREPSGEVTETGPSASWPAVPEPTETPSVTDPTETPDITDPPPEKTEKDLLSVDKFAKFSGRFVEDASDRPIEDVAAILVTNHSDRFLDLGTIGYTIDGKKATFIVTGLPPGSSCWVMEYTGLTAEEGADLQYLGCDTSFRADVETQTSEVSIRSDGEHLFATNETDRTLKSVFIYYKNVHTDGNFFGGITYMVEFGDLKPGQTVDKIGGHFSGDGSAIVRIGWQESQTDGSS